MRQYQWNVLLGGIARELVDVRALLVENRLLLRSEAVREHVHVQLEFGYGARELRTDQQVLVLIEKVPAGPRVVVIGNGEDVAAVAAQALEQILRFKPGFRETENAAPQFVGHVAV